MGDLFLGTVLRHARRALARHVPKTTDDRLLDRFVGDRDESAFAELVARHGPGVWSACRRGARNEADAQDAFQATFLVLARRANRVRQAASLGSWLFGVAVRLAAKTCARAARAPDRTRIVQPPGVPEPIDGAVWREMLALLDEELARLPDVLRAPLLCCYYQGLTQDEAARQLGWKVRTLKARVDRGRKLLRARLVRRGVDLSAALAAIAVASEGMSLPPIRIPLPGREQVIDPVSTSVQSLTREGLAMTRRTTPIVLAACAAAVVVAGVGYALGQGKPPAPPGPAASAPVAAAPSAARTDLAGDPLPPGAISRLGTTRFRFTNYEYQIFFLPEGDRILWFNEGFNEGATVTIWDVTTGQVTATFADKDLFRASIELSPDGDRMALLGQPRTDNKYGPTTLRLYDLKARKSLWTVLPAEPPPGKSGGGVRFTPDGKRLITLHGGEVRVWDVADGTELRRERIAGDSLTVSPDGKTVAVTGNSIALWDWTDDKPARQITGSGRQRDFVGAMFSSDGKTVRGVPNFSNAVPEFEVATGRRIGQLDLRRGFSFSPDGTIVAVPEDSMVGEFKPRSALILKDVATGKELRRLSTGQSYIQGSGPKQGGGAQWSKDGSRLAIVAGGRVWVWNAKSGKLLNPTRTGHDAEIRTMAFAPDGRVFTGSLDQTIRAWDPATGKEFFSIPMLGALGGIAISHDGSLLAGSALGDDLRVWDSKTGKEILKLHGHGRLGGQRRVQFSTDDQTLVSYGDDYFLRAFSLTDGKLKAEHRFWPLVPRRPGETEEQANKRFEGFMRRVMDFGPDGNTFVQSRGKDVEVIDIDSGKERVRFEGDPQMVWALAVSADGKRMATAGRGVPPPPPGKFVDRGTGPTDSVVTVWDTANYKPVTKFTVRVPLPLLSAPLAFTPDGKRIVTVAFEPVLRFFDATTGEAVGTIDLPNRPESLAFDGPGKRVVVGFVDTTALVYNVSAALKPATK